MLPGILFFVCHLVFATQGQYYGRLPFYGPLEYGPDYYGGGRGGGGEFYFYVEGGGGEDGFGPYYTVERN
ncbi:hypothetical protein L596_008636 [Steinernema carpocapsae]|uniref:Uncharacterized protein n=1 Tax=Steinernema carpocapsae TaxID=34508 RepID=A0A4U5PD68_STECR|nr:hypothetical protein L596_008636 [Steinernema carpocapsae]